MKKRKTSPRVPYAKKPAWLELERSKAEKRRARNTASNLAEAKRRAAQDKLILEEGCEVVTLRSVLDLPDTGATFVYGNAAGIPGKGRA